MMTNKTLAGLQLMILTPLEASRQPAFVIVFDVVYGMCLGPNRCLPGRHQPLVAILLTKSYRTDRCAAPATGARAFWAARQYRKISLNSNLAKSRSRSINIQSRLIVLNFDRRLHSVAAETSVKFECDPINVKPYHGASRLSEIWRKEDFSILKRSPISAGKWCQILK